MITISHAEIDTADSSYKFLDTQRSAISYADSSAIISFRKGLNSLVINIIPSNQAFRQDIIDSLLAANKLLGIRIVFSKSLKISKTISFSVNL